MKPKYISDNTWNELIEVVLEWLEPEDPDDLIGMFSQIFDIVDREIREQRDDCCKGFARVAQDAVAKARDFERERWVIRVGKRSKS